jgi:hypothetical protein
MKLGLFLMPLHQRAPDILRSFGEELKNVADKLEGLPAAAHRPFGARIALRAACGPRRNRCGTLRRE